jgi:hypothetical protein
VCHPEAGLLDSLASRISVELIVEGSRFPMLLCSVWVMLGNRSLAARGRVYTTGPELYKDIFTPQMPVLLLYMPQGPKLLSALLLIILKKKILLSIFHVN